MDPLASIIIQTLGWERWTGRMGAALGLDRFGASAPAGERFTRFGFTPEAIAARLETLLPAGG